MESALLFDCLVRVWCVGELKRMQSFMDRIYRYVWSRKMKPPFWSELATCLEWRMTD